MRVRWQNPQFLTSPQSLEKTSRAVDYLVKFWARKFEHKSKMISNFSNVRSYYTWICKILFLGFNLQAGFQRYQNFSDIDIDIDIFFLSISIYRYRWHKNIDIETISIFFIVNLLAVIFARDPGGLMWEREDRKFAACCNCQSHNQGTKNLRVCSLSFSLFALFH